MLKFVHHDTIKDFTKQVLDEKDFSVYKTFNWSRKLGIVLSDSYEELFNFVNRGKLPTIGVAGIQPKSKIYFSDSVFPATLLSRLSDTVNLKRTVKVNKADIIVSDSFSVVTPEVNWYFENRGISLVNYLENLETLQFVKSYNYGIQLAKSEIIKMHDQAVEKLGKNIYYGVVIENSEMHETILFNSYQLCTTNELIKYIQPQIAKPTDEEWEGLSAVLSSTDPEQRKLGWNILQNYDLSDKYTEFLILVRDLLSKNRRWGPSGRIMYIPNVSEWPSSMKFVMSQFNIPIDTLVFNNSMYGDRCNFLKLIDNPLNSPLSKNKAFEELKRLCIEEFVMYYQNELKLLGEFKVTIVNKGEPVIDSDIKAELNLINSIIEKDTSKRSGIGTTVMLDKLGLQYKIIKTSE